MESTSAPTKVGVIGCGNISGIYFQNGKKLRSLDVIACADLDVERAKAKAAEHQIPKALSTEQLLQDPDVELVINLTIPNAHYEVCRAALEAGKHVYVEKPLSITREEAQSLLKLAEEKSLRVGCAPDTFLGGAHQTCRQLIDEGVIGEPIGATAFMLCHGHESWHPDPEFYFKRGGGPLFYMGPYYLTALVNMIGSAKRLTGSTRATFPERTITSQPKNGTAIKVEVPTHVAGIIDFENGAIATILTSFDVWGSNLPCIELYGSEGSMMVPDPNGFGGTVKVRKASAREWEEMPLTHGYADNSRGLGVADMAQAIKENRSHRASGALAAHVLEIMHGFHDASDQGRHYEMKSHVQKPEAMNAQTQF